MASPQRSDEVAAPSSAAAVPSAAAREVPVAVVVRVRPLLGKEAGRKRCVRVVDDVQLVLGKDKAFTFDRVFDGEATQQALYESAVRPLVDGVLQGYNATVFAYGQTGSGKTFTMGSGLTRDATEASVGIIPRVLHDLFTKLKAREDAQVVVKCSFLEIYNEEIRDLLRPQKSAKEIHVRENEDGDIVIIGAKMFRVRSVREALKHLECGSAHRTTGKTQMNDLSSRSHAIFMLSVTQRTTNNLATAEVISAKLHLVDLAGSERNKRTLAVGVRFKESININAGLLALGNVISALTDERRRGVHVPYRESKLTRLLKDSLGGNSKTVMIACVSPAETNFEENHNTLKYANRAKNIKNKPIVNKDSQVVELADLRQHIEKLETRLAENASSGESSDADEGEAAAPGDGGVAAGASGLLANEETATLQEELDRLRRDLDISRDAIREHGEQIVHLRAECDFQLHRLQVARGHITSVIGEIRELERAKLLSSARSNRLMELVVVIERDMANDHVPERSILEERHSELRRLELLLAEREHTEQLLRRELDEAKDDLARDEQIFRKSQSFAVRLQRAVGDLKEKNSALERQLSLSRDAPGTAARQQPPSQLSEQPTAGALLAVPDSGSGAPAQSLRPLESPQRFVRNAHSVPHRLIGSQMEDEDSVVLHAESPGRPSTAQSGRSNARGSSPPAPAGADDVWGAPPPRSASSLRPQQLVFQVAADAARPSSASPDGAEAGVLQSLQQNIRLKEGSIRELSAKLDEEASARTASEKRALALLDVVQLSCSSLHLFAEAMNDLSESDRKQHLERIIGDMRAAARPDEAAAAAAATPKASLSLHRSSSAPAPDGAPATPSPALRAEALQEVAQLRSVHSLLRKRAREEASKASGYLAEVRELRTTVARLEGELASLRADGAARPQGATAAASAPAEDRGWIEAQIEALLEKKERSEELDRQLREREEKLRQRERLLQEAQLLREKERAAGAGASKGAARDLESLSDRLHDVEAELESTERDVRGSLSASTANLQEQLRGMFARIAHLHEERTVLLQTKQQLAHKGAADGAGLSEAERRELAALGDHIEALEAEIEYKSSAIQEARSFVDSADSSGPEIELAQLDVHGARKVAGRCLVKLCETAEREREQANRIRVLESLVEDANARTEEAQQALAIVQRELQKKLQHQQARHKEELGRVATLLETERSHSASATRRSVDSALEQEARVRETLTALLQQREEQVALLEKDAVYYKETLRNYKRRVRQLSAASERDRDAADDERQRRERAEAELAKLRGGA